MPFIRFVVSTRSQRGLFDSLVSPDGALSASDVFPDFYD